MVCLSPLIPNLSYLDAIRLYSYYIGIQEQEAYSIPELTKVTQVTAVLIQSIPHTLSNDIHLQYIHFIYCCVAKSFSLRQGPVTTGAERLMEAYQQKSARHSRT